MTQRGGSPDDFDTVIGLFEAGQTAAAAAMCNRLLTRTPGDISLTNMLGVIAAKESRFRDAADRFRDVAKLAPNDAGVITNLAQALLECGDHAEALTLFKRAGGNNATGMRLFRNSDLDPGGATADTPYIHRLNDVTLETGYWAILDGDRMYARDTSNLNMINSPAIKGRITADRAYAVLAVPDIAETIDTPCLFLGGDGNYAHWLYRYLMRLAALDERPDLASLPLLVGEDVKPYQRDSLALLGYGDNSLIAVPRNSAIQCRDIQVPICLWSTPDRVSHGIQWLRRRILENVGTPPGQPARRIFISRRDAPSRHMTNEDEVVDALEPLGIERVELGALTFSEQVSLFAQAELVVGPHGAGFANLIFAPAACRVVELVSDPIAHMSDFRVIQEIIGQQGTVVPCTSFDLDQGATKPMVQHSFRTDPEAVVFAVKSALS